MCEIESYCEAVWTINTRAVLQSAVNVQFQHIRFGLFSSDSLAIIIPAHGINHRHLSLQPLFQCVAHRRHTNSIKMNCKLRLLILTIDRFGWHNQCKQCEQLHHTTNQTKKKTDRISLVIANGHDPYNRTAPLGTAPSRESDSDFFAVHLQSNQRKEKKNEWMNEHNDSNNK